MLGSLLARGAARGEGLVFAYSLMLASGWAFRKIFVGDNFLRRFARGFLFLAGLELGGSEQKKKLEEMQDAAKKAGMGSAVYDP